MLRALRAMSVLALLAACTSSGPEPGTERGRCYPNGTCNQGLECQRDLCVRGGLGADAGPLDATADDAGASPDGGLRTCGEDVLPTWNLGTVVANLCADEWCCAEMDRCAADPTCAACAVTGFNNCGDNPQALELRLCARTLCLGERSNFCGVEGPGPSSSDVNACLDLYCCSEYDACRADPTCLECLHAPCADNPRADAFLSCLDHCKALICDSGLSGAAARNPYECARCLTTHCCAEFGTCVEGSSAQECVDCLGSPTPPTCANASPAVQQAGAEAYTCLVTSCSVQCEGASVPPVVRTLSVELSLPQARVHGEVVSAGDSPLRERGACIGFAPAPTFCIPATIPAVGRFSVQVPTPTIGEVYYARSYALTRAGKVYGEDVRFRAVFRGINFEGGIVFHTDPDGMHGLIAAPENQSTFSQWWDSVNHGAARATGATGTAVGTGAANTAAIVQALGAGNYAARLCADLDRDGFNDWYLPSKDELNLMYENRDAIGNLNEAGYWSSSEVGTTVWIQNLGTGDVSQTESTMNNAVRAIRAF